MNALSPSSIDAVFDGLKDFYAVDLRVAHQQHCSTATMQRQRSNFGARLSNPMIVIPGDENALHRRLPLRVLLAALPGLLLPRLPQVPAQVSPA